MYTRVLQSLLAFSFVATVHAAPVQVNFSGGNNTPLTILLPQPITFTVTTPPTSANLQFVFKSPGNVLGSLLNVTGDLKFTINGGSPISITHAGTGLDVNDIATNDLVLTRTSSPGTLQLGDVVSLGLSSVDTLINIPSAAPSSGLYTAILTDGAGHQVAAIPEPASLSILALGLVPIFRRSRPQEAKP